MGVGLGGRGGATFDPAGGGPKFFVGGGDMERGTRTKFSLNFVKQQKIEFYR